MSPSLALPLTDRPAGAVLFRLPGRSVDAAGFLADAAHLARTLPARAHVANLIQDRYWFAVGLAAALLRGQVSLLSGDPSAGMLARLAQAFPDAYALTDAAPYPPQQGAPQGPLARHRIARTAGPAGDLAMPAIDARQPAAIVLTSGTTGGPVGTRKNWGELVARSRAAAQRFALSEAMPATIVGTVPPGHMYGLETTILLPLHAAAAVWCGAAFFPADIAAALDGLPGARILVTTPLHLGALLRTTPPARPPERVISATAPLEPALAARAEQAWGAEVLEIFGATEFGSIASRRTTAGEDWMLYPDVVLSGPDAAPAASAPWAEPRPLSDVVERSADGRRFRLIGRAGDLVKLGGQRASLAGLSRILTGIAGVRDGAFLAPDDLDRRPTARLLAVAVAPAHSVASLTAALRAEIDPVFLPRPLVLLDALPRDALGKLPRARLLAEISGSRGLPAPGGSGQRPALLPMGSFTVPEDHPSLPGHFPGRPIVPGVVLLDHALALVLAPDAHVLALSGVKFTAAVAPGETIEVAAAAPHIGKNGVGKNGAGKNGAGKNGVGRIGFAATSGGRPVLRGTVEVGA